MPPQYPFRAIVAAADAEAIFTLGDNPHGPLLRVRPSDALPTSVFEISHQLPFLAIYRNHRLTPLLITEVTAAGGSNNNQARLWKYEWQKLADESGLRIQV